MTYHLRLHRHLQLAAAIFAASFTASAQSPNPASQPLIPVQSVDLQRYQGVWHQIALYPNKFQKSCISNTRAEYKSLADGTIQVTNVCRAADGKEMQVVGQARAAHPATLANNQVTPPQLEVRFAPKWLSWLPMVWGDYWVIQIAPDYSYAVVGEPKREFLWVLARETQLSSADWTAIDTQLKQQGYDPAKLVQDKHLP
jgi:apolipoprotein D and lipocalin family protein